jgi:hypothetical protein
MVRGGRAEAPVNTIPRSDVSFRFDQKTCNFKAAIASRVMQWSPFTEGKQKNQLAQTEFGFKKKIIIIREGQLLAGLRLYISVALQQKTANFKVALLSRPMQCSFFPEEKKKN